MKDWKENDRGDIRIRGKCALHYLRCDLHGMGSLEWLERR